MKRIILTTTIIITALLFFRVNYSQNQPLSSRLSEKILRLHVIANSDSDADQQLKLMVKEALVAYMKEHTGTLECKGDYINYINENADTLKSVAMNTITAHGFTYNVSLSVENTYFPIKTYGDLTFPCGNYDALCVRIGNACGKNWWCVLYPPLCFIDLTYAVVPDDSKDALHNIVGDNDYYELISAREDIDVKPRSLIFDTIIDFFK